MICRLLLLLALVDVLAGSVPGAAQSPPCGMSPQDWCPAPAGDRCGRHRNVADCRADAPCYGMHPRRAGLCLELPDRGLHQHAAGAAQVGHT
jgi:hypothetical protein